MSILDLKGGNDKRPGRSIMKSTAEDDAVARKALEAAGARLLEIVEGLEDLGDRIGDLREDMKQRLGAAKSEGYSVAAIKAVIRRRAATTEALAAAEELDAVADTYMQALEVAG